ncbi:hypothetical protein BpHYR1_048069 [Brachionus plicatilis]|uniref:Uncharacterized protein n=1 Tax=Brachionus plicatilis TaxID=10195 RepID=A0A3M7S2P8_BRAPC|nr:hypothetical protein BpHYR1_048069 [Brachionus plicatilis]
MFRQDIERSHVFNSFPLSLELNMQFIFQNSFSMHQALTQTGFEIAVIDPSKIKLVVQSVPHPKPYIIELKLIEFIEVCIRFISRMSIIF